MSIAKRGSTFHLRRRVPRRYRGVEPRETVWISLHTDSEMLARSKADRAWSQMIEAWEARLAGNSEDAEARYEAARDLARARGFRYLDAGNVAKLPVEDVVARVEAITAPANQPDPVEAAALLGTVPEPRITVAKALQLYWTLAREKTFGKSEDQLRRWEAPRKKAVKNFVAVVGDKEIANITRDDMLDFRQHWLDRIEAGEVTANSANKDLIHLGDVLKTVNTMKRLGVSLPLGELSFKEGEKQTRPPFSEEWIRTWLLAPGVLDGLNGQARAAARHDQHRIPAIRGRSADGGDDPVGLRCPAYLDPTGKAAIEVALCPPRDPADRSLARGLQAVSPRASLATATAQR